MTDTLRVPDRQLSPAKRSLVEKRLRGAFRRDGCSSRRTATRGRGSVFVPLQTHGSKPPLVLVHGAGGGLLWGYRNLAAQLGNDQPVYAIEPRSLQHWRTLTTVEDMAAAYLEELRAVQPTGPYYVGGYCFGALIAYEIARRLWLRCERVGALIIIDGPAPNGAYYRLPWWRPSFLFNFTRNGLYWIQDFRALDAAAKHKFFRRKIAAACRKWLRLRRRDKSPDSLDLQRFIDPEQFPDDELVLWKMHLQAEFDYEPRPYPGHVTLLRTRGHPIFCSFDPYLGWGELAGSGVTVRLLPGAHERIFEYPDVVALGQTLRACLSVAPREHTISTL